jgi:hypothetical protein
VEEAETEEEEIALEEVLLKLEKNMQSIKLLLLLEEASVVSMILVP